MEERALGVTKRAKRTFKLLIFTISEYLNSNYKGFQHPYYYFNELYATLDATLELRLRHE